MKTRKMMRSILLLVIFWYSYLAYVMIVEMGLSPLILLGLTMILLVLMRVIVPLERYERNDAKEREHI